MSQPIEFMLFGTTNTFSTPSGYVFDELEKLPVLPHLFGSNGKGYSFLFGVQGTKFFTGETPYTQFVQDGPTVLQYYVQDGSTVGPPTVSVYSFLATDEFVGFVESSATPWSIATNNIGSSETKTWTAPPTIGKLSMHAKIVGNFILETTTIVQAFDHYEFIGPNNGVAANGSVLEITTNDSALVLAVYTLRVSVSRTRLPIPKPKIPKKEWPMFERIVVDRIENALSSRGIKVASKEITTRVNALKVKFVAR